MHNLEFIRFYWVEIGYNRDVLTPRLETEYLVRACLQKFIQDANRVIDVWTGSWAIVIALAKAFASRDVKKDCSFYWSDISHAACTIARYNASHNSLSIRIEQWDLLEPFFVNTLTDSSGDFLQVNTLCVANLPYIAENESIGQDVIEQDPATALYGGGKDGFDCIRRFLEMSLHFSEQQGWYICVLEFWHDQSHLFSLWCQSHLRDFGIFPDQLGINRFGYCIFKPFIKKVTDNSREYD